MAAPSADDAIFLVSGSPKWRPVASNTWTADFTKAKAADLAARVVRVSGRPEDDGKYAKYTASGFVLADASNVEISAGGASKGQQGSTGPTGDDGAQGNNFVAANGAVGTKGPDGDKDDGEQGQQGPRGDEGKGGAQGASVQGVQGTQGAQGPARAALDSVRVVDAVFATGTESPASSVFSQATALAVRTYTLTLGAGRTLVSYAVRGSGTASWTLSVDGVVADQRSSVTLTSSYGEYFPSATPPGGLSFVLEVTAFSAATAQVRVRVV